MKKDNSRKRRHVTDGNGNRILRVVKRDATEMAEVETTEKIIQVKAVFFNIKYHQVTKRFPHGGRHFQEIYGGF